MLRFILKLILLALVGYGVYFYIFQDQKVFQTSDLPEVGYQEAMKVIEELKVEEREEEVTAIAEEVVEDVEVVDEIEEPEEAESERAAEFSSEEPIDDSQPATQLPVEINLAVPFTPQAPHANWSLPYQEACEEASAYMVWQYYQGRQAGLMAPGEADKAILEVVAFQKDFFGFYEDTTAAETAQFIDMFYGLGAQVIDNPTVDEIKAEVAAGRPVIMPAAGRQLGNPNFIGAGPLYHMLVIKGYTAKTFITNDPGTRNGQNYVYQIDVLMSAMGDWNGGDPASGAKRVIFVTP